MFSLKSVFTALVFFNDCRRQLKTCYEATQSNGLKFFFIFLRRKIFLIIINLQIPEDQFFYLMSDSSDINFFIVYAQLKEYVWNFIIYQRYLHIQRLSKTVENLLWSKGWNGHHQNIQESTKHAKQNFRKFHRYQTNFQYMCQYFPWNYSCFDKYNKGTNIFFYVSFPWKVFFNIYVPFSKKLRKISHFFSFFLCYWWQ